MTGKGHVLTGLICTIATYAFMKNEFDLNTIGKALGVAGMIFGSTAPDWMEIRKKTGGTIIPHRTITHWLPLWVLLFMFSVSNLPSQGIVPYDVFKIAKDSVLNLDSITTYVFAFLTGFSLGGLLHLATDIPNPMGIPILTPKNRFSLKLWESGKNETFIAFCVLFFNLWYAGFITINLKSILVYFE